MKSDDNSIEIDHEASETIIKICFMVKALKEQSCTVQNRNLKKVLDAGDIIQSEIDALLGSAGKRQFVKKLIKSENTISLLLDLYATLPREIPNISEIERILKNLKKAILYLQKKVDPSQFAN